jgi:hypothetical protein
MSQHLQVCQRCGGTEVARCKWVNVNNNEIYSEDSGTTLEWCWGECQEQTTIIDQEDYTPQNDEDEEDEDERKI